MITLPPKRFQPTEDPRYDGIRHRPWFGQLVKRRVKIKFLKAAREAMEKDGKSQKDAAEMYGVDERELRDYCAFCEEFTMLPLGSDHALWSIIDDAYSHYQGGNAKFGFRHYLESQTHYWGINPRRVTELWEVDPCYYPTGYQWRTCAKCAKCGEWDAMVKHADGKWYCHHTHDL